MAHRGVSKPNIVTESQWTNVSCMFSCHVNVISHLSLVVQRVKRFLAQWLDVSLHNSPWTSHLTFLPMLCSTFYQINMYIFSNGCSNFPLLCSWFNLVMMIKTKEVLHLLDIWSHFQEWTPEFSFHTWTTQQGRCSARTRSQLQRNHWSVQARSVGNVINTLYINSITRNKAQCDYHVNGIFGF